MRPQPSHYVWQMRASLGKLCVQEITEQQGHLSCCVRIGSVVSSRLGFVFIPSCSRFLTHLRLLAPSCACIKWPSSSVWQTDAVGDVRSLCPPEQICKWGHRNLKWPQWQETRKAHSVSFLSELLGSHTGLYANQGLFIARAQGQWGKEMHGSSSRAARKMLEIIF